jgi:hypothetical protein
VLVTFLQENLDVFTWQISDMLGIPKEVIEHKLGIDPAFKPIKQKERRYTLERRETTRVEVNKLLEARLIKPVDYPSWLAHHVLVGKLDGSWYMCIDYTSLNKVCPKDEYPCLIFVRSWILQHFVNSYHFWMRIWAIIKSALPQKTKRKHHSSHRSGFSATPRWHSG